MAMNTADGHPASPDKQPWTAPVIDLLRMKGAESGSGPSDDGSYFSGPNS